MNSIESCDSGVCSEELNAVYEESTDRKLETLVNDNIVHNDGLFDDENSEDEAIPTDIRHLTLSEVNDSGTVSENDEKCEQNEINSKCSQDSDDEDEDDNDEEAMSESNISIAPDLLARLNAMKGAARKDGPKRVDNSERRRQLEMEDESKRIHSDVQRQLRETEVRLPYHQPTPITLAETMERIRLKKQNRDVKPNDPFANFVAQSGGEVTGPFLRPFTSIDLSDDVVAVKSSSSALPLDPFAMPAVPERFKRLLDKIKARSAKKSNTTPDQSVIEPIIGDDSLPSEDVTDTQVTEPGNIESQSQHGDTQPFESQSEHAGDTEPFETEAPQSESLFADLVDNDDDKQSVDAENSCEIHSVKSDQDLSEKVHAELNETAHNVVKIRPVTLVERMGIVDKKQIDILDQIRAKEAPNERTSTPVVEPDSISASQPPPRRPLPDYSKITPQSLVESPSKRRLGRDLPGGKLSALKSLLSQGIRETRAANRRRREEQYRLYNYEEEVAPDDDVLESKTRSSSHEQRDILDDEEDSSDDSDDDIVGSESETDDEGGLRAPGGGVDLTRMRPDRAWRDDPDDKEYNPFLDKEAGDSDVDISDDSGGDEDEGSFIDDDDNDDSEAEDEEFTCPKKEKHHKEKKHKKEKKKHKKHKKKHKMEKHQQLKQYGKQRVIASDSESNSCIVPNDADSCNQRREEPSHRLQHESGRSDTSRLSDMSGMPLAQRALTDDSESHLVSSPASQLLPRRRRPCLAAADTFDNSQWLDEDGFVNSGNPREAPPPLALDRQDSDDILALCSGNFATQGQLPFDANPSATQLNLIATQLVTLTDSQCTQPDTELSKHCIATSKDADFVRSSNEDSNSAASDKPFRAFNTLSQNHDRDDATKSIRPTSDSQIGGIRQFSDTNSRSVFDHGVLGGHKSSIPAVSVANNVSTDNTLNMSVLTNFAAFAGANSTALNETAVACNEAEDDEDEALRVRRQIVLPLGEEPSLDDSLSNLGEPVQQKKRRVRLDSDKENRDSSIRFSCDTPEVDDNELAEIDGSSEGEEDVDEEGEARPRRARDFFDAEAELSGDDVGSDDEDEDDDNEDGLDADVLGMKLADEEDLGSRTRMRKENYRQYMRTMRSEDERVIELMKEYYLPDAELTGPGRMRAFRWASQDDEEDSDEVTPISNSLAAAANDEDEAAAGGMADPDDAETEAIRWRLARFHRESYLLGKKENKITAPSEWRLQTPTESSSAAMPFPDETPEAPTTTDEDESQLLSLGRRLLDRRRSCLPGSASSTQLTNLDDPGTSNSSRPAFQVPGSGGSQLFFSEVSNQGMLQLCRRGSFMSRRKESIKHLADAVKEPLNPKGPQAGRGFLFTAAAKGDDSGDGSYGADEEQLKSLNNAGKRRRATKTATAAVDSGPVLVVDDRPIVAVKPLLKRPRLDQQVSHDSIFALLDGN